MSCYSWLQCWRLPRCYEVFKNSVYLWSLLFKESKVYHERTPTYITENFTLRSNANMSLVLRSSASGSFIPPEPRTECFKQSMRYSGCLIWNSLPHEVKKANIWKLFTADAWSGYQGISMICYAFGEGKWSLNLADPYQSFIFFLYIYIYIYVFFSFCFFLAL